MNWLVRMTSDLEANIVAVERVKEYSEIPSEVILQTDLDNSFYAHVLFRLQMSFLTIVHLKIGPLRVESSLMGTVPSTGRTWVWC